MLKLICTKTPFNALLFTKGEQYLVESCKLTKEKNKGVFFIKNDRDQFRTRNFTLVNKKVLSDGYEFKIKIDAVIE